MPVEPALTARVVTQAASIYIPRISSTAKLVPVDAGNCRLRLRSAISVYQVGCLPPLIYATNENEAWNRAPVQLATI